VGVSVLPGVGVIVGVTVTLAVHVGGRYFEKVGVGGMGMDDTGEQPPNNKIVKTRMQNLLRPEERFVFEAI